MGNANIDALYAGGLRIKYHITFLSNFTFYRWCVTKVAHCSCIVLLKKSVKVLCSDLFL